MKASRRPSIPQLAAMVAAVLALALGFSLGRRATTIYQLRHEEAYLRQAVEEEKAETARLEARRTYVLSDAFVEEWARTVAKLTRPGEVRVVLLNEGRQPAELKPILRTYRLQTEKVLPCWQQWWELFFGSVAQ